MNPYLKCFMKQYQEEDRSYPPPELQLCLRLDTLEARLEELADLDFAYSSSYSCSEEDIKYSSPEHLYSIFNIKKAIELTESELIHKYGVFPEESILKKPMVRSFV